MKILAIRGANIASLAGNFAVELESEPLKDAGLFAITGPTGAGKSSLLDTLCLALFDTTPRLREPTRVHVGASEVLPEHRLTSTDARAVLTRGATRGMAEVDFLGRDGRRYRATWEVRRAHDRASGRLQKPEMRLFDLAAERFVGDSRTEVKVAIEDRLGLGFDQFRRSALLAQGDFAAFLFAKEADRSELLERMTGTEIYGELSKAAHQRFVRERDALGQVEGRLEGIVALATEARAALEADHAAAAGDQLEARARYEMVRAERAWITGTQGLEAEVAHAESASAAVEVEWGNAEHVARQLEAIVQVEPLRALVDDADRSSDQAAKATQAHAHQVEEAARREDDAERSRVEIERVRDGLDLARSERARRQPALDRAHVLEAQHESGVNELARVRAAITTAAEADAVVAQELDALQVDAQRIREAGDAERNWLDSHPGDRTLVENERVLDALLEPLVALDRRCAALRQQHEGLALEVKGLREGHDQATRELGEQLEQRARHRAALERLEKDTPVRSLAGATGPKLKEEALHLDTRLQGIDRLEALLGELSNERTRLGALQSQVAEVHKRRSEALARSSEAEQEKGRVEVREQELGAALSRARASRSLAFHRAELVDGKPCPLCGSESHPWKDTASPLDDLLQELEGREAQLRKDAVALDERARSARNEESVLQVEVARLEAEVLGTGDRIASLLTRWEVDHKTVPLLPPSPDAAAPVLHDRRRSTRSRLKELDKTLKALAHRDAAFDMHTGALQQLEPRFAELEQKVARLEHERELRVRRLDEIERELAEATHALTEQSDSLAATFADGSWRRKDLTAFRAELVARMDSFKAHQAELEVQNERHRVAQVRLAELERAQKAGSARRAELDAERAGWDDALRRNREERATLVGTERAEALRTRLDRAVAEAEATLEGAVARAHETERARTEAATRRKVQEELVHTSEARARQTRARLDEALARMAIEEPTVRALLAHDPTWIDTERRRHDELRRRKHALEVRSLERRERLEAWRKQRPQRLAEDGVDVASLHAEAEAALEGANQRVAELTALRLADDAARTRRSALHDEVTVQRARFEQWAALEALIGSHDGKKLRVFAQSLTLDAVLAYANVHLESLTGRYRLMRVPGYDLELQVRDRDLGDEIRSVQTLSGGESFLVSLALALGLASLSTQGASVGTLFIDEGFGTLDPDTLETVLYTLDRLRADGRQIGIISHVESLAERIGAHVRIAPRGGGRSTVSTRAA